MDIFIIRDDLHILMDIVIVDLTRIDMVQRISTITTYLITMAAQEKTRSYTERALGDDFIHLAIEMYGCLHSCFDSFLTTYAHTTIMHHQWSSLIPLMFISHY
jgi:hypothetical protein